MSDPSGDRARPPRPQFGEFATPEEQRAAIAVPDALTSSEPVPVEADRSVPTRGATAPERTDDRPPATAAAPGTSAARPPVDRFISWGLLGIGLFSILQSTATLIDLPTTIERFFASADIDPYGPVTAGRVLGFVGLAAYVVLWVLALVLVQRRVASGRSSWWIPLIAGVVANVVVVVCVGSAMMIDPSIAAYIQEMAASGSPTLP